VPGNFRIRRPPRRPDRLGSRGWRLRGWARPTRRCSEFPDDLAWVLEGTAEMDQPDDDPLITQAESGTIAAPVDRPIRWIRSVGVIGDLELRASEEESH